MLLSSHGLLKALAYQIIQKVNFMQAYNILLGGEERSLQFGKVSFLKHLGSIAGDFDLLDTKIFSDPSLSYKSVLLFVRAGLMSGNYKDLTESKVEEWVDDLGIKEVREIQYNGFAAITGKTVEELKNLSAQVVEKVRMNGV